MPEENKKYLKAKKRVEEIKGFYIHLAVFLVVVTIIVVINAAVFAAGRSGNEGWNFWFLFPFGFWGFAVLMHGLKTFMFGNQSSWEKKKIKQIMDDMDRDK